MESLIIVVIISIVIYWYSNMQSREIATRFARNFCEKQGYQFLDGSVYQRGMNISFNRRKFRRYYEFFYTENNHNRQRGTVILVGKDIEHFITNEESITL